MTGEEQQIELNLDEEAFYTDCDQVVPDPQEERSMVATSAEVHYNMYILVFCHRLFKYPNEQLFCLLSSGTPGAWARYS